MNIIKIIKNIEKERRMYNVYGINDLKDVSQFKELKKEKSDVIKPILIDLLKFLQDFDEPLTTDNSRKIRIVLFLIAGLLRKNQVYNESDIIDYFIQVKSTITSYNNKINSKKYASESDRKDDLLYYSDFSINLIVNQLENHLKKNHPSEKLKHFISEMLKWNNFKCIRKTQASGYKTNQKPIQNAFLKLYMILQQPNGMKFEENKSKS